LPEEFNYEQTVAEIQKLQQQNLEKVKLLAQAGKGIDPGVVANIKIDTFVQLVLDQRNQAAYVLAMEQAFQTSLNEGLAQVRKEQLTQGVKPAASLFVPKG
jgi:elongation factor P--beta-lysine ligase